MASKEPQVVVETSGISTGEYRNILTNFGGIERALKADETATETLTTKFKSASWLDTNAKDVGPKELLTKALDMVENSTKYYYTFKEMVQGTTGLQHILPNFKPVQEFNPAEPIQDLVVSGMVGSGSNKWLPQLSEQDLAYVSSQVLPENESDVLVEHASQWSSDKAIFIETKSHLQSSETSSSTPIFQLGGPEILEDKENADKIEPVDGTEHTHMQEESCYGDLPVAKYTHRTFQIGELEDTTGLHHNFKDPALVNHATSTASLSVQNKGVLKEKPTLKKLLLIKYTTEGTKNREFRTLDKISPHWIDIADYLEVNDAVISNAESAGNQRKSARTVMSSWILSTPKASWSRLIKAMKVVPELTVSAVELQTALLNQVNDSDDSDDNA